jgi:hypothetical protein
VDRISQVLRSQIERLNREIALIRQGYKTTKEKRGEEWSDTTQETLDEAQTRFGKVAKRVSYTQRSFAAFWRLNNLPSFPHAFTDCLYGLTRMILEGRSDTAARAAGYLSGSGMAEAKIPSGSKRRLRTRSRAALPP